MASEFRVLWRREGLSRRTKLFQRRDAAERWMLRLEGRMAEVTGLDPDADAGDGRCNQSVWDDMAVRLPPLIELALHERPVGEWEPREERQPAPFPALPTDAELIAIGDHAPQRLHDRFRGRGYALSMNPDDDIPF